MAALGMPCLSRPVPRAQTASTFGVAVPGRLTRSRDYVFAR